MNFLVDNKNKMLKYNYSKFDKIILFLYSSYFVLFPYYFWDSGLPQLSDLIIVLALIIYLLNGKFKLYLFIKVKPFLFTGLLFISYVIFSNLVWTIIVDNPGKMWIVPAYYIFNFIVCVFTISLYAEYGKKFLKIIYKAIIISTLCQLIMLITSGGFTGGRMTLSFNNPNQLGYYALLTSSILIFLSDKVEIKGLWFLIALISNLLLIIASLSSTAIVSYMGLMLLYIFSKTENKKIKRKTIFFLIILLLAIFVIHKVTDVFKNHKAIYGLRTRASTVERKTENLITDRGYYRITEYPEYWILGAGEGAYLERFGRIMEFHSTLGNIQVSYGIIGLILFLKFLYLALKNNKFRDWYILFCILIYGITHNGIRNSLFWIFLALLVSF